MNDEFIGYNSKRHATLITSSNISLLADRLFHAVITLLANVQASITFRLFEQLVFVAPCNAVGGRHIIRSCFRRRSSSVSRDNSTIDDQCNTTRTGHRFTVYA